MGFQSLLRACNLNLERRGESVISDLVAIDKEELKIITDYKYNVGLAKLEKR